MQHCDWNTSLNVFPPYNSSSFYIDDILRSGSQQPRACTYTSQLTSTMSEVPEPPCLSPPFHLPPLRTYNNLSSPFTPYHSSRGFGFHAPSIPCVYEAYNDHSAQNLFSPQLKRKRTWFSKEQIMVMETVFKIQKYITPLQLKQLSMVLQLREGQVKTWFNNRRAKSRRFKQKSQGKKSERLENEEAKAIISGPEPALWKLGSQSSAD